MMMMIMMKKMKHKFGRFQEGDRKKVISWLVRYFLHTYSSTYLPAIDQAVPTEIKGKALSCRLYFFSVLLKGKVLDAGGRLPTCSASTAVATGWMYSAYGIL